MGFDKNCGKMMHRHSLNCVLLQLEPVESRTTIWEVYGLQELNTVQ